MSGVFALPSSVKKEALMMTTRTEIHIQEICLQSPAIPAAVRTPHAFHPVRMQPVFAGLHHHSSEKGTDAGHLCCSQRLWRRAAAKRRKPLYRRGCGRICGGRDVHRDLYPMEKGIKYGRIIPPLEISCLLSYFSNSIFVSFFIFPIFSHCSGNPIFSRAFLCTGYF